MNIHQQAPDQLLRASATPQHANPFFVCAVLVAALSGNVHAQNDLNAIGGGGGGAFHSPCAATGLLTGFELRTGDYVDSLRPLCVTATGPREVGAPSDSRWHGGTGGGLTRVVCPGDKPIVTGMFVGTDSGEAVVNNILLYCNVAAGSKPSGDSPSSFARPGPAGSISATHDDSQACPAGQVAVGVHGRSGLYLDAVGLICDVPRLASTTPDDPAVKSIGRVGPPSTSGPLRSICDAARDARARNSPAAPNLEAQCRASRPLVSSIGKATPAPANALPASTPPPADTMPATPPQPPAPVPPTQRETRDAALQALIGTVVSTIQQSRDNTNRNRLHGATNTRVDGSERRRDPLPRDAQATVRVDQDGSAYERAQPDGSIRIQVRYPAAYGYKDAAGLFDPGPNSCGAFYLSAFPTTDVRPREPTRIEMQPRMRDANGIYACDYLIHDQPIGTPVVVRVAMSDQRAAGSAAWLGGSQPQPPAGQRRTIVDGDRQVVLTSDRPSAALRFEMIYAGSR